MLWALFLFNFKNFGPITQKLAKTPKPPRKNNIKNPKKPYSETSNLPKISRTNNAGTKFELQNIKQAKKIGKKKTKNP